MLVINKVEVIIALIYSDLIFFHLIYEVEKRTNCILNSQQFILWLRLSFYDMHVFYTM